MIKISICIDKEGDIMQEVEYKEMNNARIRDSTNITKHTDFLAGLYGPERLGSPFGPPCYCGELGFHRIGMR